MKNESSFSIETTSHYGMNLLWIDAASVKEIISAIIFFLLLLFSLILFGFCGHEELDKNIYHSRDIISEQKNEYIQVFDYYLTPFDLKNRFVRFSISFNRNITDESDEMVVFNYSIQRLYDNGEIKKFNKNVTNLFHLKNDQDWTDEYILYTDFILNFNILSLSLFLNTSDTSFISFEFNSFYGNSESTLFSTYYRVIFTVIHIFSLFLLLKLKRSNEVKYFCHEQILIFPLIISITLSNNPFCIYKLFYPTSLYCRWMLYTEPITDGIIYFTQIILFVCFSFRLTQKKDMELLLPDNSKIQNAKFIKISIYCFSFAFIYIIIDVVCNQLLSKYYYFNNFPSYGDYQKFKKINYFKSLLDMIFSLSTLIFALVSLVVIDVLAIQPFVYLSICIIIFIQKFLFEGFFIFLGFLDEKDNSLIILLKLIIQNVICFFIAYIHFPYDIREQCSQIDSNVHQNSNNVVGVDENKGLVVDEPDLAIDCD